MNDEPKIIWEKWRDPYGYDDILELYDLIQDQNNAIDDLAEEDDMVNNTKQAPLTNGIFKQKIPFMFTTMGIIPYTENTAASHIFNFWTGHTNFNLSKKICDIIEKTDGIETLDIFTRYRFRIGVGKCFEDSIIMRSINKHIMQHFLS